MFALLGGIILLVVIVIAVIAGIITAVTAGVKNTLEDE